MKHHPGVCKGGPYDGQWWDYFKPVMVVLTKQPSKSGEYLYNADAKIWLWKPLVQR